MTTPHPSRLQALRDELRSRALDGFLVPMADPYGSEYVPASAQRIGFLSGFTGSSGFIIVLTNEAAFFTDSRYTLQAATQIPAALFTLHDSATTDPVDWLKKRASQGLKIGFDPWLHRAKTIERFHAALADTGTTLVPQDNNPVDAIWPDRPPEPAAPIHPHPLIYAGQTSAEKRHALAAALKKQPLHAAVLTDSASIAWLLNVRGGDVPHTPLPLSFAILHDDASVAWFVDPRKITTDLPAHLGPAIAPHDPAAFPAALEALGHAKKRVRLDPSNAAYWIAEKLRDSGATLDLGDDPCALPKASKNDTELQCMSAAHLRDGVAVVRFLAWLDANAPQGTITELSAEEKLAEFRAMGDLYQGPSFDTIAGSGPHAAIVHYRATPETNRLLEPNTLFLLDSGGQYRDGTTDITRTIVLGAASDEVRDRFTRVLKGHIALASAVFPRGTTGADLDVLARQFLWQAGLDYGHGTGHGIGSYLGVHEGPQGISRRSTAALKPTMLVTNEPGFYAEGRYGIRHENVQAVVEAPALGPQFLRFQPLTLAPFDRRGIDTTLLTPQERAWLNGYHKQVYETLESSLDEATRQWLLEATKDL